MKNQRLENQTKDCCKNESVLKTKTKFQKEKRKRNGKSYVMVNLNI